MVQLKGGKTLAKKTDWFEACKLAWATRGNRCNDFLSRCTSSEQPLLMVVNVTSKKSPNIYERCPKMISLEKLKIFTLLQKLLKNVGDLGKLIVVTGFEKLPKVQ